MECISTVDFTTIAWIHFTVSCTLTETLLIFVTLMNCSEDCSVLSLWEVSIDFSYWRSYKSKRYKQQFELFTWSRNEWQNGSYNNVGAINNFGFLLASRQIERRWMCKRLIFFLIATIIKISNIFFRLLCICFFLLTSHFASVSLRGAGLSIRCFIQPFSKDINRFS